ncbi:MAG: UbiH/UbiF family hydroxylase [Pseudaminobacter sp.]|nr:UbiH/UbiF family hydroxylase [Pseudaminobacter sp.]
MAKEISTQVTIAGAGPAGFIAALAFAHAGFSVCLAGPGANRSDRRTTAMMSPALEFLDTLGVLQDLQPKAAPLRVMRVIDATSRLIRSPTVTFHANEIDKDHFALNVPNQDLNAALENAVISHSGIEWHRLLVKTWRIEPERIVATLSDGVDVASALAVAADGRLSPAREAAGITTSMRSYPQAAIVVNFAHSRAHASISTEFHTETGPFTQVPLPGNRSSLVWVVRPETAEELAALGDAALSVRIEDRMQSMLGAVSVEPGRQVYPLSAAIPVRFAQNRVALVGEAAHVFPPIGAQGLNLGVRDIVDLVEIMAQNRSDPGSPVALSAYDAKRRPDILARSGAVGLLNRSLLSGMLPAQMIRSAGLGALGRFAPLRALFMREGLQPGSGFSSILSTLREQVRR